MTITPREVEQLSEFILGSVFTSRRMFWEGQQDDPKIMAAYEFTCPPAVLHQAQKIIARLMAEKLEHEKK